MVLWPEPNGRPAPDAIVTPCGATRPRPRVAASRGRCGFTLVELLVVVGIMIILAGMLSTAAIIFRARMRVRIAKVDIKNLVMALSAYHIDLHGYPPDEYDVLPAPYSTLNSNQLLAYHLGRRLRKGPNYYGPYMEFTDARLVDPGDGYEEYRDPWGELYHYFENQKHYGGGHPVGQNKRTYDLISGGPDRKVGGTERTDTIETESITWFDWPTDQDAARDDITNWSD
jgi:type II secretory pathway pseudopilin PulG